MQSARADADARETITSIDVPSRWTALTSHSLPHAGTSWSSIDPPIELLTVPSNINVQPKLAEILNWSLQRPSTHTSATPQDLMRRLDAAETQDVSSSKGEAVKRVGSIRSRRSASAERNFPGIKAAKNDLKAAFERVKTLKQKHDLERAVSMKRQKEIEKQIEEKTVTAECTSCFEDLPLLNVIKLTCSHSYCKTCLATLIVIALQNESAFPPKCCLSEIPPETVIMPLDNKQREQYKLKAAEYSIPANRRWYCPNTACTKWIPPTKLQRDRMVPQKCPHCSIKICSICRGRAHQDVDCPQDFGLEATLDIAESEGWKRCYSCRTMVERQVGCRHITCRCGAEFCYVCGARWRTCHCTEADEASRQTVLRRQRLARDVAAQAEAAEVARAIAAVERLAREDEERRRQREVQRELERQREEAELARLEQIRLQEEEQRRREELEAEQQFAEVLRLSLEEESEALIHCLCQVFYHQHVALDDRHGRSEQQLLQDLDDAQANVTTALERLQGNIARNVQKRADRLKLKHEHEIQALTAQQEEQEDDIFLQIQLHLRGKANKDTREKKLRDELKREQESESRQLGFKQQQDYETLEKQADMELEGILRSHESRKHVNVAEHERRLEELRSLIPMERIWFHTICGRRKEMVQEHNRIIMEEFQRGVDTIGLTEELAARMSPLPVRSPQPIRLSTTRVEQSPVELEAPVMPERCEGNISMVYRTAPSSPMPATVSHQGAGTTVPAPSSPPVRPPPSPPIELPPPPMPKNGNAYLCTKNGEASKPVYFPPMAPPTPPESPLPSKPDIVGASGAANNLSVPVSPYIAARGMRQAKARRDLHLTIPQRDSGVSSLETTLTPGAPVSTPISQAQISPIEATSGRFGKKKHRASMTTGSGGSYMTALESTKKDKSPVRDNIDVGRKASVESVKVKKSRNPFKRKQYTEEEIKEKMRQSVGDAFA